MKGQNEASVEARRQEVAATIARGTDPSGLAMALRDSDWRVREEAILGIRRFRAKSELVPELISALSDATDIAFRNAAAAGLALVGATCVGLLEAAIPSMDADARKLACEVCAQIPSAEAVTILLRLAEDVDENVQIASVEALGQAAFAGPEASALASALLLRLAPRASVPLRLAVLQSLAALGVAIGVSELEVLCSDALLAPYAVRAASGATDTGVIELLAKLVCREGSVAVEAICALAASLAVSRGAVFLACARGGAELRRVLWTAATSDNDRLRSAATDLLPAVFHPAHVPIYLSHLGHDATADAAARALAMLAPMVGGHLLTSVEYIESESLAIAARVLAPLLDEESALSVSRILLVAPPEALHDVWLEVLLGLETVETEVSWENVYAATRTDSSANRGGELLARRARREPHWVRNELSRTRDFPRARSALLLGLSRVAPLSPSEAREVEVGIGDEDAFVREWSLLAVAHGVTVDRTTVISALSDEKPHAVVAAIGAAARMGCISEIEDLAGRTTSAPVLVAALSALAIVSSDRALQLVERRLRGEDERLAAAALSCVPLASNRLVEICELALDRGETTVVLAALRILQDAEDARAASLRVGLLDHERWEVRALTAAGLPVARFRQALVRRLETEENSSVIEAIRRSLLGRVQGHQRRGA